MKPKRRNDLPPMSPCKNRRSRSLLPTASAIVFLLLPLDLAYTYVKNVSVTREDCLRNITMSLEQLATASMDTEQKQ